MATNATFDGHFRFEATGGKISRDVKGTEQEFANHLRDCGEAWITEHTNDRVSGRGEVTVAYHYGWGEPTTSRQRRRLRRAAGAA